MIIRFLAIVLFKIFFRLQAFGRKGIPSQGGVILAANHASYIDPPVLGAACPRKVYFLAKEEIFRNAFFGRFISALHAFPVSQSGDLKSLRRAIRELKAGRVLTIFPEGRRVADGESQKPLKGIGLLAAKADVPIVPAYIEGSGRALPIGSKFIRPKKVRVYFGRPIAPQVDIRLSGDNFYQALAEKTMQEVARLKNMAA